MPQAKDKPEVCYEIAEIKEATGNRKRITMCDGLKRETTIYVSKSNVVTIQFVSGATLRSLGAFLLKYQGKLALVDNVSHINNTSAHNN